MEHKMKLLEDPFMRILNGSKEVEFRLYDEKKLFCKFHFVK